MGDERSNFRWYEIIQGDQIAQGDFLNDFPIIIQPEDLPFSKNEIQQLIEQGTEISVHVQSYNVIVMTQSCDFNKMSDQDFVTLCARYDYKKLYGKNQWDNLRNGRKIGAHILNKCELSSLEFEYQIVDLTQIFNVPYIYVNLSSG